MVEIQRKVVRVWEEEETRYRKSREEWLRVVHCVCSQTSRSTGGHALGDARGLKIVSRLREERVLSVRVMPTDE